MPESSRYTGEALSKLLREDANNYRNSTFFLPNGPADLDAHPGLSCAHPIDQAIIRCELGKFTRRDDVRVPFIDKLQYVLLDHK